MSARKSRVRPVPDFSRAHQLFESQLEARKKDMKKCTKVEEFNLSRPFVRGDGSSATPVHCLDITKPSPRHPDFIQLQANPIRSPIVSSSDVKVPKPKDCTTMNCEPGLKRKATGILKNAGKTDESTTGQKQVRCAGAPLGRRPRVTFDIASPLRESPLSMPRRVLVTGWSYSLNKTSPKPAASRTLIACNRVPVEPCHRTTQSTRSERSQPGRVLLLGSGQRITISQSCSRAACMGGFSRFRADSIAKAIDFNEESEEDGKSVSQDGSKNAQQPAAKATGVIGTKKKFSGLKGSPVRKIHVDVTENEDASVSSPLLRLNSNSDAVVRSPLLRKMERIERKDAKNRSRLPQPKDPKGKVADKENRAKEKKRKSRDERESVALDGGSPMRNCQDQHMKMEATSPSVKRDDLEQLEVTDTFDPNQTISKLEKKAQRLRRRSQLTEEKSEQDCILKKLEALEKKIESMRMVFHSMRQTDSSNTAGDGGSFGRSISTSDDPEPGQLIRNESNVCPTERFCESLLSIHDARPESPAVESTTDSQAREEMCETPVVTSEIEPEPREDTLVSNVLVHVVSEIAPETKEDNISEDSNVVLAMESKSTEDLESGVPHFVSEIESQSKEIVLSDVTHVAGETELQFEEVAISDVPPIFAETESQIDEIEIDVPNISLEIESTSEVVFKCDNPCFPLPTDNSEWKENIDPLSEIAVCVEDVSLNNSIETGTDNPLRGAEPCGRIIFQDITGEMQSRTTQFDEDDGIFVVEGSSDDSDLMNSEDFTEWSSSPIALMNQCLTNIESELSSELSAALTPEDVLVERLAKFSISDRLETSNVEASPNMSSEFMQYNRYEWREGVDGGVRLFNPVAAALIDAETDDAHFVPISPSP